ncbi:MAG: DNA replication/repair protein RecF [Clostridiales bacterium]|jgi:DNA replication and repair protein RecF|nr:DNA replication/repair protein RecF [Clostridiales bacterium]
MYISEIILRDFRNYSSVSLALQNGVNIFCGANAQGKTNLVEAIYYTCVGRSPRTPRDKELIRWDGESAYLSASAQKACGKVMVEGYLTRTEKRISINGLPISRMGELMGAINAVFFSPDELKIIKESPSDRRRFMDIDISQLSKAYFYDLNRYNKTLAQRNRLLKTGGNITDQLSVWDLQLADTGSRIIKARAAFIDKLKVYAKNAHAELTDGAESLDVDYECIPSYDRADIREAYLAELSRTRTKDLFNGYTNIGVHKDDIALGIGGADIRAYGSQGQQRTATLALKLAELEIFAGETGEYPILILDDVLSELDTARQRKLIERIKNVQTLITCTHTDIAFDSAAVFTVKAGSISREQPGSE